MDIGDRDILDQHSKEKTMTRIWLISISDMSYTSIFLINNRQRNKLKDVLKLITIILKGAGVWVTESGPRLVIFLTPNL